MTTLALAMLALDADEVNTLYDESNARNPEDSTC